MSLEELIARLEKVDPSKMIPLGFHNPHSYRGYCDELAFEPVRNVTVREMLADARGAIGKVYVGYKGGEFRMNKYTSVWLAQWGETGEILGPTLLSFVLGEI